MLAPTTKPRVEDKHAPPAFVPGYLFIQGTRDVAKAWDQFNENSINCAGAVPAP
jgi:hypothetical protein